MISKSVRSFAQNLLWNRNVMAVISTPVQKNAYSTEVTFETKPFRLHKLESGPETNVTLTRDDAIHLYKQMHTIRRMETSAGNLYKEKIIRGFCHLYSGQEAVAVGIKSALRENDSVITAYRAHGWTYLMGSTELGVLAELTGRQSGCARGKGGSMHMYAKNFYGGNGIVGAQTALGAGIAFANKYHNDGGVCMTVYGDGAANQGQLYEALNMSKLWNLPCIFVCENNGYAMGTSTQRGAASVEYYTRGDYVPGVKIDGMDVLAMREATKFAIDFCTKGNGPIILEAATYRYSGHSMSDPGTSYRSREEIQEVRQTRDPITSFKEKIITVGLVSADELKTMEAQIRTAVDNATNAAKADKEIGMNELTTDIYYEPIEETIRNITSFEPLPHTRLGKAYNM